MSRNIFIIITITFYEKYTLILGCIYCNKWQEAQIFEFVPNQKSKTIELKEKIEKPNLDLSSLDHSSSENLTINNNQNTTLDYSEIHDDTSQNLNDNQDSLKEDDPSTNAGTNVLETTESLNKALNQENKKKGKRKLGFLQMRIDSTIYFDNMGYSYQIQNEKNDKK